jgi:hypothetical protein
MDNRFSVPISRRTMLERSGLGFGSLVLAYLSQTEAHGGPAAPVVAPGLDLSPKPTHFPAKARAVIQLMQNGGPSHVDLFDPKPELQKRNGLKYSEKLEVIQKGSEANQLLASPFQFNPQGKSGIELSELLPHTGSIADEICLIRSMYTEHNEHSEALVMLQTGKIFAGRPTMGAWISYALGTENQNLPAYIVLRDPQGYNTSGAMVWDNGFLPALFRGTEFSCAGAPVLNLQPAVERPKGSQADQLALLARLNEEHRAKHPENSELEARIRNYELAARMQLAAGKLLDLSKESEVTRTLYGLDNPVTAGYGLRCLMARRLVEAGVRFVQVFPPVEPSIQPWDHHTSVQTELPQICAVTDLPAAGLVKDLKSRGLLKQTLVMWTGEFGRLPISQKGSGRDHNRNAFSMWLAGGGFKAGHVHGATDEIGYRASDDRVSVPDLHATILNQLGLDHRRVAVHHHGREETLTDYPASGAQVVKKVLA